MPETKTQPTARSAAAFLDAVPDAQRRADAHALAALMARVSGEPAAMWGSAIVGFGRYHYRYDSGREGEMCRIGFSPRAKELVLYLTDDFAERAALLARLGKHRTGKACLYVRHLADVDATVLETIIAASLADIAVRYPD